MREGGSAVNELELIVVLRWRNRVREIILAEYPIARGWSNQEIAERPMHEEHHREIRGAQHHSQQPFVFLCVTIQKKIDGERGNYNEYRKFQGDHMRYIGEHRAELWSGRKKRQTPELRQVN